MTHAEKTITLVGGIGTYFAVFGGLHALPICRLQQRLLMWAGMAGAVVAGGYAMSPGLIDKHLPIIGYADNVVALLAFAFSAATFWFARREMKAGHNSVPVGTAAAV